MLNKADSAKQKWGGIDTSIDRWLSERKNLIVRYCDLIDTKSFESCEVAVNKYRSFCQVLLDYVSAGHFEIYDRLVEEAESFKDGSEALATELYPKIQLTTEAALDFNDTFDKMPEEMEAIEELKPRLSELGQQLEDRFEMEDLLIEKLHTAHAGQVA
ncbi:sigma D regulator [Allohahella marinimesophila]|uniref:Rsd/AlgQ family anti-sigma factor n=1 Tax=Allohahella marinimesophila TaxID=1054972 RepID=A0ABP7PB04_9GAMM